MGGGGGGHIHICTYPVLAAIRQCFKPFLVHCTTDVSPCSKRSVTVNHKVIRVLYPNPGHESGLDVNLAQLIPCGKKEALLT